MSSLIVLQVVWFKSEFSLSVCVEAIVRDGAVVELTFSLP